MKLLRKAGMVVLAASVFLGGVPASATSSDREFWRGVEANSWWEGEFQYVERLYHDIEDENDLYSYFEGTSLEQIKTKKKELTLPATFQGTPQIARDNIVNRVYITNRSGGNTSVETIVIPEDATYNVEAVTGLKNFKRYKVSKQNKMYHAKSGVLYTGTKEGKTDILKSYPCGIKKSVYQAEKGTKQIASLAFYKSKNLKEVKLPSTVKCIEFNAFESSSIQKIALGTKIDEIMYETFLDCTKLKKVTIKNQKAKSFIIDDSAFCGCKNLQKISLPSKISKIGTEAFRDCKKLKSISFGKNNDLANIGYGAFENCESLKRISFRDNHKLTEISEKAFSGCKNIEKVTFGEKSKIKSIGWEAFENCKKLKEISIPDSVSEMIGGTFDSCSNLEKVTFGKKSKLKALDTGTFYNCKKLKSFTVPAKVKSIRIEAFRGCKSLRTITIPAGVTKIDKRAFQGCSKKLTIICKKGSYAHKFAKEQGIQFTLK